MADLGDAVVTSMDGRRLEVSIDPDRQLVILVLGKAKPYELGADDAAMLAAQLTSAGQAMVGEGTQYWRAL